MLRGTNIEMCLCCVQCWCVCLCCVRAFCVWHVVHVCVCVFMCVWGVCRSRDLSWVTRITPTQCVPCAVCWCAVCAVWLCAVCVLRYDKRHDRHGRWSMA